MSLLAGLTLLHCSISSHPSVGVTYSILVIGAFPWRLGGEGQVRAVVQHQLTDRPASDLESLPRVKATCIFDTMNDPLSSHLAVSC